MPSQVKPIEYLMETLDISRESVYRRIRGDIAFTFEEVAKLAVDLGFSLDELIIKDMHSRIFFDVHFTGSQSSSDIYLTVFKYYFQDLFELTFPRETESILILNHVPPDFIVYFNHLFKFAYYRWMHQSQESSLKYFYSDVVLPEELISMQQKVIDNSKKIRNNTLILDSNVFLNLIQEVQYYYKRKLINENEFALLTEDLHGLVNMVEGIAQTGIQTPETKFYVYLSALSVESSSRYLKYDDQVRSQFFINSLEQMTISNPNLCVIHKKWLESMRKYTTLISQSNEILQVKYFDTQRKYINEMTNAF